MTEQNKHPEESGLDLFRPTAEDERKGITGITMEQEIVSVATLRARKRRRRAVTQKGAAVLISQLQLDSITD